MNKSRSSRFGLFTAVLLSGTLAVGGFLVGSPLRGFVWLDILDPPKPPLLVLGFLLAPPLFLIALGVWARLSVEAGDRVLATADWELLLREKQQGLFLHRSSQIRDSARRVRRWALAVDRAGPAAVVPPSFSGEVLGQLVERKRRGEWSPVGVASSQPE
jgi:hypothetical protein